MSIETTEPQKEPRSKTRTITISMEQHIWLESRCTNLSKLVRGCIIARQKSEKKALQATSEVN